jgi:hypothetical protein
MMQLMREERVEDRGPESNGQQYFSLRTNQPPATSQQYSSLRTNQHPPSATSQPLLIGSCRHLRTTP